MSVDGENYIRKLASFIRAHEKQLAMAAERPAAALPPSHRSSWNLGGLLLGLSAVQPLTLTLTPHHLVRIPPGRARPPSPRLSLSRLTAQFYLLSQLDQIGIDVGPMNTRLEILRSEYLPTNYISFLSAPELSRRRELSDAAHSRIKSVGSITALLRTFSWSPRRRGDHKTRDEHTDTDLKYIYSSFTKLPSLGPDRDARLILGHEEFPFDTAVSLVPFKNLSTLELRDVDIRVFYGWHLLSERLHSLTVRRGGIQDPIELTVDIALDDLEGHRQRSSAHLHSPAYVGSVPSSPAGSEDTLRFNSSRRASRSSRPRSFLRSYTVSSQSSTSSSMSPSQPTSLLRWRFLRYLSLAENALASFPCPALLPIAGTITSLELSHNHFTEYPLTLACLPHLKSLSLSHNAIGSLHNLLQLQPLTFSSLTLLTLRGNRLGSLLGIERLSQLQRLDLRDNQLADVDEIKQLTDLSALTQVWVSGNPFTQTRANNFRISIFNMFRTAELPRDIQLEGKYPTLTERHSLVEHKSSIDVPFKMKFPETS